MYFLHLLNCYRKRDISSCLIVLSVHYYFTRLWLSYIARLLLLLTRKWMRLPTYLCITVISTALFNLSNTSCCIGCTGSRIVVGLRFNPATPLFNISNVHQAVTRHGNYSRVFGATLRALNIERKYQTSSFDSICLHRGFIRYYVYVKHIRIPVHGYHFN